MLLAAIQGDFRVNLWKYIVQCSSYCKSKMWRWNSNPAAKAHAEWAAELLWRVFFVLQIIIIPTFWRAPQTKRATVNWLTSAIKWRVFTSHCQHPLQPCVNINLLFPTSTAVLLRLSQCIPGPQALQPVWGLLTGSRGQCAKKKNGWITSSAVIKHSRY